MPISCPVRAWITTDIKFNGVTLPAVPGRFARGLWAVIQHDTERYGRMVAEIILPDGRVLNKELVRAGHAWWYSQYDRNDTEWQHWKPTRAKPGWAYGLRRIRYRLGSGARRAALWPRHAVAAGRHPVLNVGITAYDSIEFEISSF
jgi:Staphylococcal nuclease homologue